MKNKVGSDIVAIFIYMLLFIVTLVGIQQIWSSELFDTIHFLNWDADHYNFIKEKGYKDFRLAFFPLFPIIWRFLDVGVYAIILINSLIFFISFYILIKNLEIKGVKEILMYLSIPSFVFFYLPYSESIFFLCSLIIILGLKNNKNYLVYIGLFLSILSRPAFTVFIPALIITQLLNRNKEKISLTIGFYLLVSILGIISVGIIQFYDSGEWFKFFSEQKNWGNQLQIPKLPLTSWAGGFIVRTDGFAFLIGVLSGSFLTALILKLKWVKDIVLPKEVIFSLAYLGGITIAVLLFRGGSLFSLNRFVFATPFIIVVLNYWIKQQFNLKIKKLLLIFGLIFIFWFLFGSYVHIQQIIKFGLLSLYATLIFALKSDKEIIRKYSLILLIIINFSFQIIFYIRFLNGDWVG
ncbi:MAG: hypothetical protein NTY55_06900 [Flavobacteriia bacterium]|nr:hypothetical protein [Flavobacteriia bacterium]